MKFNYFSHILIVITMCLGVASASCPNLSGTYEFDYDNCRQEGVRILFSDWPYTSYTGNPLSGLRAALWPVSKHSNLAPRITLNQTNCEAIEIQYQGYEEQSGTIVPASVTFSNFSNTESSMTASFSYRSMQGIMGKRVKSKIEFSQDEMNQNLKVNVWHLVHAVILNIPVDNYGGADEMECNFKKVNRLK